MRKIIPHIAIILTAMMITLFILDYLNPLMGFLSRNISKIVIILWITSIIATIISVIISIIHKIKDGDDYETNN